MITKYSLKGWYMPHDMYCTAFEAYLISERRFSDKPQSSERYATIFKSRRTKS